MESEWHDSVKKGLSSDAVEGNFDILSDLARRPDCDLTFARPDKKIFKIRAMASMIRSKKPRRTPTASPTIPNLENSRTDL